MKYEVALIEPVKKTGILFFKNTIFSLLYYEHFTFLKIKMSNKEDIARGR